MHKNSTQLSVVDGHIHFDNQYCCISSGAVRPELHRGSSAHLKVTGGQETYTEEEKRVLLQTSHINRKEYVPFMRVDLRECFKYSIPFTDKDGLLALSPKQKRDFGHWARPDEIYPEPKMVVGQHVDCLSIKQTVMYIIQIGLLISYVFFHTDVGTVRHHDLLIQLSNCFLPHHVKV